MKILIPRRPSVRPFCPSTVLVLTMYFAVWAKRQLPQSQRPGLELIFSVVISFPYFPAEIIDQTDPDPTEIPPSVFKNRAQAEKENGAAGKKTWLVRFFDAQASYGWIPASRLDLLGEDNGEYSGLLNREP